MADRIQLPDTPANTWKVLSLLRPFFGQLVLLSVAAIFLSFLTGITQVTLTPLLEIVLKGNDVTVTQAVENTSFTFDLNELGQSVLGLMANLTGLRDPWTLLLVSSGAYLTLALIGQVAAYASRYWALKVHVDIARDLSFRLFDHVMRLPLSVLNRFQTGWLQAHISGDVRVATRVLNDLIIDGLSSSLLSVFYAALLMRTSIRLTLVAALAGVAHVSISRGLTSMVKARTRIERSSNADFVALTQERLAAVREVKAMAAEDFEQQTYWDTITVALEAGMRHSLIKRIEAPVRWVVNRLVIIVVMLFGAWDMLNGNLSTSAFLLFMFFSQSLIEPLGKLAGSLVQMDMISANLETVAYFLDQPRETHKSGDRPVQAFEDEIRLENVSFAYVDGDDEVPTLHNVSLTIKRGEMVALVGRSGAGKSTLVDLILRFFEPTAGRILLDDIAQNEYQLQDYRRLFGVVSQDTILFDDTVYNNIAYARPHLSRKDVIEAARIANAEGFILEDLPDGFDTWLGERGVRLSGGQRQRIAIARAVAHKPEILILDEATSSLDTESERLVQGAIARVIEGSTAIVIAHRLSTIRMADKIVVLKEGCIVETGTHDELLELNGEYSYLYNLQFRSGADVARAVLNPGELAQS